MSLLVSQHLPQVTPVSSHIPFFFNGFSNFPIRVIPFTCINQRCPPHRLTPSTHVCTSPTTLSYPCFNRFSHICLNLPAFQPTFTFRLTHVSPHWLVSSNYGFRSVTPSSWNTRTISTGIMDQIKEIKSFFPFSLPCSYHLHSIDWTDDCITGNGGKSTAHVVPALIRVCWFSVSLSVWFHVQLFPFCPPGKISTTSTSDDQRSKRIRFTQVMIHFYLCVCV